MEKSVGTGGGCVKSGPPEEGDERRTGSAGAADTADHRRLTRALADAMGAQDAGSMALAPAALCRICVDLLDVNGASVSLSGQSPDVAALWWSSDSVAAQLAEAQYSLGDGPCHTARSRLTPVLAGDLTGGTDAESWPVFAERAVGLGVRAVFSLPLGSDALAIGSLDLYRREPGPLSGKDTACAFVVSDAIALALMRMQSRSGAEDHERRGDSASWLDGAESEHEEVHYATGMLMVQLGVEPHHALARLRAHAFAQGQTVTEAARDVLARRVTFDE
jgi:hypothetical protein